MYNRVCASVGLFVCVCMCGIYTTYGLSICLWSANMPSFLLDIMESLQAKSSTGKQSTYIADFYICIVFIVVVIT